MAPLFSFPGIRKTPFEEPPFGLVGSTVRPLPLRYNTPLNEEKSSDQDDNVQAVTICT